MEELAARAVHAFVGMGAEIVTLGLEQVCWHISAPIAVEVREGRAHRGKGDSMSDGGRDYTAPALTGTENLFSEVGIQQKVVQFGIAIKSVLDPAQEGTPDDA